MGSPFASLQTAARRSLARTARRIRHGRPRLSIIVLAVGGDPGRLRATLSSVRDQASPALEIVVVVSDDQDEPLARSCAAGDTRTRFFRADSVATARSVGVQRSRGEFVVVAAPGDVYPGGALVALLDDLVPDSVLLLDPQVGATSAAGLTELPQVAGRPYLGRLLMARSRLRAAMAAAADLDPDGFLTALQALRGPFQVVGFAAYRDARADSRGPFLARQNPFPGLPGRVARDRATLQALADLELPRAARARAGLADLRPFLEVADTAEPEQWSELVAHAALLASLLDSRVPGDDVVGQAMALLAAADRRPDVVALASAGLERDFATVRRDGRVVAVLPGAAGQLSEDDREVSGSQTPLVARARRMYLEGSALVLEILVGIRHVDQAPSDSVVVELVGESVHPMRVRLDSDVAVSRWMAEPEHDHDAGLVRAEIDVAELPVGMYGIGVLWTDGEHERAGVVTEIAFAGSAARRPIPVPGGGSVGLHERNQRVALGITGPRPVVEGVIHRVEVDGDRLRLRVDRTVDALRLEGEGRVVVAEPGVAGFWTVPLAADSWGLGVAPLPSGTYRFALEVAGTPVVPIAAPGVVDLLPAEFPAVAHRVQLHRGAEDRVLVRLDPQLADDEVGVRAQRLLRAEFEVAEPPIEERLVYFQSFTGQWANDNPLAIQQALAARRPDLDVRWVVADSSASVPSGATPLLFRSRDWYDVMTRAGYLVTNIELEKWFVRRPGQQILQTFHGYPSKAMGLGLWESRGLAPHEISAQLARTSGVWNNLLTPTPEMDQYYRRDYAYQGRILSLGYPRNDVLVGSAAQDLRSETRARLGIGADQRAVLYAPTWRDDLATNFRSAEAVHHLDVGQARAALGDQVVWLMRGHRFHAPTRSEGSLVLDVTGYPDINHLIAASDAAVLDYSSLRFDFALTGRPMVFLVPDLDSYDAQVRGFLWDYRETAPGPLVSTTAEVVSELADLDALAARYGPQIEVFNTRYNRFHDGHAADRVVAEFFAPLLS